MIQVDLASLCYRLDTFSFQWVLGLTTPKLLLKKHYLSVYHVLGGCIHHLFNIQNNQVRKVLCIYFICEKTGAQRN